MQSFRSEIENPIVEKDIVELANKIEMFHNGKIDEEKFRSLRLARGVYGQRQEGVQMIRIKLPYGKVASNQLRRISDVSDEYSRGRLHITTRQDIQIHYVDLNRTPELWAELEKDNVTLREACGNVVRNVTASETAGFDVNEPFDIQPYAHAIFEEFLRNPICQEMGRKFKVSFSSTEEDTGLSYMHDIGFIAKEENGVRGFKIMVAGGLGSQPRAAEALYEFLPSDEIIPLMNAILRVFDRHGERKSRAKARMKFLMAKIGLDGFKALVEEQRIAVPYKKVAIDAEAYPQPVIAEVKDIPQVAIKDQAAYENWKKANLIPQRQEGYVAVGIKVLLGDFYTKEARLLADLVDKYAAGEVRLTLRQNIVIPFVKEELLPVVYTELEKLGFVEAGYNKAVDITACPGTDTCNLGIASSTGIAEELERVIKEEYPSYVNNTDLVIKISGCMNACGQHNMANIGFQGMTIRTKDKKVAPALQVLLGGGNLGNGDARFADKVVKIPAKRGPEALRRIFNDYEANANGLPFVEYYIEKGERYFYDFLTDLSEADELPADFFVDWGNKEEYVKAIGVGECAGVVIDLIETLFLESDEKIANAKAAFEEGKWSDAIYFAYTSQINSAKAILLAEKKKTNTQADIVKNFDNEFVGNGQIAIEAGSFSQQVFAINQNEPTKEFATDYIAVAEKFLASVRAFRAASV